MTLSANAVRCDDNIMWVELSDGRTLGIPLVWFPRLLHATPEQRQKYELTISGIHWDELDEDISVAGLLAGEWTDRARRGLDENDRGAQPHLTYLQYRSRSENRGGYSAAILSGLREYGEKIYAAA